MIKISIGILGFNEAYGVVKLLESLQDQTLLKQDYAVEIIVVSNGSTDDMVTVAKDAASAFTEIKHVDVQVVDLPVADKCAAWNHFVHEVSSKAEYYILLDADVVLVNPNGLAELIDILKKYPECRICGGKVVNQHGEILPLTVDGKCYAAKGEILQNIVIPEGIISDDAYVAITIVTNWYETGYAEGLKAGFIRQAENITISCGHTPRDNGFTSYNLTGRKRTIMLGYTQKQVDYCMRNLFGGGETARDIAMTLFRTNPGWFIEFLMQSGFEFPHFDPPSLHSWYSPKVVLKYLLYYYCYMVAAKGIRDREFGHLAWKLKGRFW